MSYKYITEVEIIRINDTEVEKDVENPAGYANETIRDIFEDADPLLARRNAFNRANSYGENFEGAGELFFKLHNDWHKEYSVKVFFINPDTEEEILIHDSLSIELNKGLNPENEIYDLIQIKWILDSLQLESNILNSLGISLSEMKEISVKFLPSNNEVKYTVFPTPWINLRKMTIQEITF